MKCMKKDFQGTKCSILEKPSTTVRMTALPSYGGPAEMFSKESQGATHSSMVDQPTGGLGSGPWTQELNRWATIRGLDLWEHTPTIQSWARMAASSHGRFSASNFWQTMFSLPLCELYQVKNSANFTCLELSLYILRR